jgi:hypothetical protein
MRNCRRERSDWVVMYLSFLLVAQDKAPLGQLEITLVSHSS